MRVLELEEWGGLVVDCSSYILTSQFIFAELSHSMNVRTRGDKVKGAINEQGQSERGQSSNFWPTAGVFIISPSKMLIMRSAKQGWPVYPQQGEINNPQPPAIDSSLMTCTRKFISTSRSVTAGNQISLWRLIPPLEETTAILSAGSQVLISLSFLWWFPTLSVFCARITLVTLIFVFWTKLCYSYGIAPADY